LHIAVLEAKEDKMKKVMLVIVCLAFAATAFAQQSDPSNDVGYVKLNSTGSGTPGVQAVLPFGLPFKFWVVTANVPTYGTESTRPSSIVGAQINPGSFTTADRLVRQDGGAFAYRLAPANNYTGSLETGATMIPGRAYFYQNKTGANRTLVLAGDVDNAGGYGTITITGGASTASTPISWRDSRNLAVATTVGPELIADGFTGGTFTTSDQIIAQIGGASARASAAGVWSGTLTTLAPGQAYFIQNRVHGNGTWVYDYATGVAAGAASVAVPAPSAPSITKAPVNNSKEAVKTSSVKTEAVKKNVSTK
jgi:hypothetical protein